MEARVFGKTGLNVTILGYGVDEYVLATKCGCNILRPDDPTCRAIPAALCRLARGCPYHHRGHQEPRSPGGKRRRR